MRNEESTFGLPFDTHNFDTVLANTMGDTRLLDCNAPGFIKRYFATSRLHHLSTWKADIADFVIGQMSAKRRSPPFKASRIEEPFRTIMHIDMDCFFASVGVRDRPHLLGKPVAVAHSQGGVSLEYSTSEIASCNYEARAKGVKNGMFIGAAKELAPDLQIIPYEFEQYDACSKVLYQTLLGTADFVQSVSCDEAFVDVTFCVQKRLKEATDLASVADLQSRSARDASFLQLYETVALDLANEMRETIFSQTRCRASVGIASNILLARIATSKAKPNGVHSLLQHGKALLHLKDLPIRGLPGVGRSTSDKCAQLQLVTCGDVQVGGERNSAVFAQLRKELGEKTGENLYEFCWGRDDRMLENKPRQSVGSDINWGIRFVNREQVEHFLKEYCVEVYERLDKTMHTAGHVTVNVKKKMYEGEPGKFLGCGECLDLSRSMVPGRAIASAEALFKCVSLLYKEIALPPVEVRGVGIHLKKLQPRQTSGGSFFKAISRKSAMNTSSPSGAVDSARTVMDCLLESGDNITSNAGVVAQKEPFAPSNQNIRNYFSAAPSTATLTDLTQAEKIFVNWKPSPDAEKVGLECVNETHFLSAELGDGTGTQNSESDTDYDKSGADDPGHDLKSSPIYHTVASSPSSSGTRASFTMPASNNLTSTTDNATVVLSMEDVDLDVFMALPEEIQRELQRSFENTSATTGLAAATGPGGKMVSARTLTTISNRASSKSYSPPRKRAKASAASTVGTTKGKVQGKAAAKLSTAGQPSITSIWGAK